MGKCSHEFTSWEEEARADPVTRKACPALGETLPSDATEETWFSLRRVVERLRTARARVRKQSSPVCFASRVTRKDRARVVFDAIASVGVSDPSQPGGKVRVVPWIRGDQGRSSLAVLRGDHEIVRACMEAEPMSL